ncbi:cupin domain-containing protein [Arthrobacter sp. NPDC089319]|uniref:cupin domain-containing protein n=1 Tax=Arthrobacter sp. NPDC089319 TaxID=3155915 RepID=UPI00341229DD
MSIEASAPTTNRIKVVRESERESLWFLGDNVQLIVDSDDTEGRLVMAVHHAAASSQPPLHEHDSEDEIFFILQGEIKFWSEDTVANAGVGDCVLLPKDVPHTFQVSPNSEAKWLVILSPGGFDRFFRAVGTPAGYPGPQRGWSMDRDTEKRLGQAAADCGIRLLGPPGTLPEA